MSETISTCRFGERAKKIKNIPKINRELTKEELEKQVDKLLKMLKIKDKRISQLEHYIDENGGSIPDFKYKNVQLSSLDNFDDFDQDTIMLSNVSTGRSYSKSFY